MGDLYQSPADPLFYLHHANLDRVWWSWQKLNLNARLTDISGPINMMDYTNTIGGNVTLDFPLTVGVSAEDVTVGDVMNVASCGKKGALCYEYDRVYTLW
jgi:tyrosinase